MSLNAPTMPLPTMPQAPAPPVIGLDTQGKKPKAKSTTPTFLGADAVPTQSSGGAKTLLGQ